MSHSPSFRVLKTLLSFRIALHRDAPWMRSTARFVLAAWFLPIFLGLFASLGANQAKAQELAPRETVVVLDFAVPGGSDTLLGRKAADGLAVELQRSGEYTVVTRQQVEEAVGAQAGLKPPFTDVTQTKLANTVKARYVFSGRVVSVDTTAGRAARVRLEVRQLDAVTGDYVNGTQVIESTEQKLQDVPTEILVDEAINKAVFSAVRSMHQVTLPEGTVLNTTRDDLEISIGARNGVVQGQRYTVLRDIYNRGRQVTERAKIGEITIMRVESDQAQARVSAGGGAGVRTGDRVRQIFEPVNYPISPNSTTTSITPVNAPPVSANSTGGLSGLAKKGSRGVFGILALAGLVSLAGFGGGGNTSAPTDVVATPGGPQAAPTSNGYPVSTAVFPTATVTFSAGFKGINFNQSLQQEAVAGYLIYRGESPDFAADISNLQGFIDARNVARNARISFTDPAIPAMADQTGADTIGRTITLTESNGTGSGGGSGGSGSGQQSTISLTVENGDGGNDQITEDQGSLTIDFTQRPLEIGRTYYYKVGRVAAERVESQDTGGGTGGGTSGQTQVNLLPVRSPVSDPSGAFTPLLLPQILTPAADINTDNFSLAVEANTTPFRFDANDDTNFPGTPLFSLPVGGNVTTGVDQFRIEVSISNRFPSTSTFARELAPPVPNSSGQVVFNLGDIRVPDFTPGTPIFVRVLSRNTQDSSIIYRGRLQPLEVDAPQGQNRSQASRFIASPRVVRGGGIGGALGGRVRSGPQIQSPRILRPQ